MDRRLALLWKDTCRIREDASLECVAALPPELGAPLRYDNPRVKAAGATSVAGSKEVLCMLGATPRCLFNRDAWLGPAFDPSSGGALRDARRIAVGDAGSSGRDDTWVMRQCRDHSACAVDSAGRVTCWGGNTYGQLGAGDRRPRSSPTRLDKPRDVTDIATSGRHSCAVTRSGDVYCWGANRWGELGTTPREPFTGSDCRAEFDVVASPVRVDGIRGAVEIAAGGGGNNMPQHTCARTEEGFVSCWGSNHCGQLGDGTQKSRSEPRVVRGIERAVQISAAGGISCALLEDGSVRCWGSDDLVCWQDEAMNKHLFAEPRRVDGIADAVEIAVLNQRVCARTKSGVLCSEYVNHSTTFGPGARPAQLPFPRP